MLIAQHVILHVLVFVSLSSALSQSHRIYHREVKQASLTPQTKWNIQPLATTQSPAAASPLFLIPPPQGGSPSRRLSRSSQAPKILRLSAVLHYLSRSLRPQNLLSRALSCSTIASPFGTTRRTAMPGSESVPIQQKFERITSSFATMVPIE